MAGHPAAEVCANLFSKLLGFDLDEARAFFKEFKEGTSLMSDHGFLFVEASESDARTLECYIEHERSVEFKTGNWVASLECRRGGATLQFTGEQFFGIPVLVEFAPESIFGLPPKADCVMKISPGTTLVATSYQPGDQGMTAKTSFEPLTEVLLKLAVHDALETLPDSHQKGLRLDLSRKPYRANSADQR
jgi:hypothetical protein